MKTEITPEDYKDYYQAVDWNPVIFEKLLRHFGYDFGNLIVNGFLDLDSSKITHFVGVKEIDHGLWLTDSAIESLGDLQKVAGNLDLYNTPIKSLGNLQTVGGYLDLKNTPISQKHSEEEIRKMVEVGGTIYM